MSTHESWFLFGAFLLLPAVMLAIAITLLASVTAKDLRARTLWRGALTCVSWMVGWCAIGASNVLDHWESRPPRAFLMVVVLFAVTFALAFGKVGTRMRELPTRTLIALQAFRLPVELLMYRAALEGLMPIQMSFAGYNYEIVTASTAALIGAFGLWSSRPLPHWLGWAFSALGLGTLTTILVIALASMPTFAAFGPDRVNTWVTHFPYVLLPAVLVQVALFGHLVLLRKLNRERDVAQNASTSGLTDQRQGA